jgi:hypothetical protein
MKTFEEKFTAWLDDQLTGSELAEFEASLPDKAAAEAEKKGARQLGLLLKRELVAPALTNEDFFSHQLRERIAREEAIPARSRGEGFSAWWTIRRLFLTGATALAAFVIFAVVVLQDDDTGGLSDLTTKVLTAKVDPAVGPNATVTMFESKEDRVTVLWTEGLKSLPSDYASK